jgi:parallel beta-helix repeat protein
MLKIVKLLLSLPLAGALLAGCAGEDAEPTAGASNVAETLRMQLIDAAPGDVIEIPSGKYEFDRSLSLRVDGVTIRGAGMNNTILSFSKQKTGAEGLLVTADDFIIEDLAIEDTKGDALKVNEGRNIIIRRVRTEWTGGPKTENGAYGIYPVQTVNVLLEENVAIGASDAGIYVGQSENVIVRKNRAEYNVAGIEIENTIGADVYGNRAINNTGGILVFNMPNLSKLGSKTRIYKNEIAENNYKNFATKGTAVASVPSGTGVIVNANDEVEIFDNDIRDNKTANIIITSLYASGLSAAELSETFDAYPEAIYVLDNLLEGGGSNPDGFELKALKTLKFGLTGSLPDILWDGYVDDAKKVDGALPDTLRICVQNGAAQIMNLDAANDFKSPYIATTEHDCQLDRLAPVVLADDLESR